DEAAVVLDLDHHLRPHPVVAGAAVPLARAAAAGALEETDAGQRAVRVPLADALVLGDEPLQQALLEGGDAAVQLLHLLGHRRLLRLPAGELGVVARLDLLEALALLGELLLRLLEALEERERLLLGGGDLRLGGVDLLEERAVLALRAHPVDLLLVLL